MNFIFRYMYIMSKILFARTRSYSSLFLAPFSVNLTLLSLDVSLPLKINNNSTDLF